MRTYWTFATILAVSAVISVAATARRAQAQNMRCPGYSVVVTAQRLANYAGPTPVTNADLTWQITSWRDSCFADQVAAVNRAEQVARDGAWMPGSSFIQHYALAHQIVDIDVQNAQPLP